MFLKKVFIVGLLSLHTICAYCQKQIGQDLPIFYDISLGLGLDFLKIFSDGEALYYGRTNQTLQIYYLKENSWRLTDEHELPQSIQGTQFNPNESIIVLGRRSGYEDRGITTLIKDVDNFKPSNKIYTEYSFIPVWGLLHCASAFHADRILLYSSANNNSIIHRQVEFFDLNNNHFTKSLTPLIIDEPTSIKSLGFFDNDRGVIINYGTPFYGSYTHRQVLYKHENGNWHQIKDTGIYSFTDYQFYEYNSNINNRNRYYVESLTGKVTNILVPFQIIDNSYIEENPKLYWYYYTEPSVNPRFQDIGRKQASAYSFNSNGNCVAIGGNNKISEDNKVNFFYFNKNHDLYIQSDVEIYPDNNHQIVGEYINISENGKYVIVSYNDTIGKKAFLRVFKIDKLMPSDDISSNNEQILFYNISSHSISLKPGWHLTAIYDISGRMVMAHVHDRTVPTEHLSPGIYIAVLSDGQQLRSEKFVKL